MISDCSTIQLHHKWMIRNFDKALEFCKVGACLQSVIFTHENLPNIYWQMELYPNGDCAKTVDHVSLYLFMRSKIITEEFTQKVKYVFHLLDDTSTPHFKQESTADFKMRPPRGSDNWGWNHIPKDTVAAYMRSDKSLVVLCEIEVILDVVNIVAQKIDSINKTEESSKDFMKQCHDLYASGVGSDFVIECENKEFNVHKFILIARSEVFRAMLTNKSTAEAVSGRVRLIDINPTAVDHMIIYMYSDALPDNITDADAQLLMVIAEKYALDGLKNLCQDALIEGVTNERVLLMLPIADTHSADKLMDARISIIDKDRNEILNSEEWAQLENTNPRLVNSVLKQMVGSKS